MKPAKKYKSIRPSKGERLNWPSLKDAAVVSVTEEMLQGRQVTEKEIESRQRFKGKISLLVP
jgi:hypothetical protein